MVVVQFGAPMLMFGAFGAEINLSFKIPDDTNDSFLLLSLMDCLIRIFLVLDKPMVRL